MLPLKTFSYLAAGRPIVAGALPDVSEILVHDRNAILTPPDSPEAAAGALGSLLADPALMTRLSQCARRDAEAYTWEARGKRVHGYMRRLLADRNAPET